MSLLWIVISFLLASSRMTEIVLLNSCLVCIFQDLGSGKTIGSSRAWSGLYFLKVDPSVNKQIIPTAYGAGYEVVSSQSCFVSESSSDKDVMVWHYCLGHLNFPYLSKNLSITV